MITILQRLSESSSRKSQKCIYSVLTRCKRYSDIQTTIFFFLLVAPLVLSSWWTLYTMFCSSGIPSRDFTIRPILRYRVQAAGQMSRWCHLHRQSNICLTRAPSPVGSCPPARPPPCPPSPARSPPRRSSVEGIRIEFYS